MPRDVATKFQPEPATAAYQKKGKIEVCITLQFGDSRTTSWSGLKRPDAMVTRPLLVQAPEFRLVDALTVRGRSF